MRKNIRPCWCFHQQDQRNYGDNTLFQARRSLKCKGDLCPFDRLMNYAGTHIIRSTKNTSIFPTKLPNFQRFYPQ